MKKKLYLSLIIIVILISISIILGLGYSLFTDFAMCVDIGICPEGVKFKDYTITKDYCLKSHYKWDNLNRTCNLREKTK